MRCLLTSPVRLAPAFNLLVFAMAMAANSVWADEGDVFNFFAGHQRTYDSNVFRLSGDANTQAILGRNARDDVIKVNYFGGTFNERIGRQKILLEANLNQNRYESFDMLNYDGNSFKAKMDWVASDVLTGSISKNSSQAMAGFGDVRTPIKNIVTRESEAVSANVWLDPLWRFETGASKSTARNGSALYRFGDSDGESRNVGMRYMPSSNNTILLRASRDDGAYPNRVVGPGASFDNVYQQKNVGIDFYWQANGLSALSGAIGRAQRKHPNVPSRDVSGTLGNLTWDWHVSGASSIMTKLRRDVSSAGDNYLASTILTNAGSVAWNWQLSAKTSSSLQFERRTMLYQGDPVTSVVSTDQRRDSVRNVALNLNYRPMNSLTLTTSLMREQRDSNYVGIPYSVHTATLGAQFSF